MTTKQSDDQLTREKLVCKGVAALSDSELLSILLREGDPGETALGCAERLLAHFGGRLNPMGHCTLDELRMSSHLGVKRAATLVAAFELSRRFRIEQGSELQVVHTDRDITDLFAPLLSELAHEEFWVVYLNAAHRVIERTRISQGGVSATVVDARLIVKRAVERLAHAMILVHNHPSGNSTPSREDEELTERLRQAAALFDIALLDHIIIASNDHYSLRNHGFFDAHEPETR